MAIVEGRPIEEACYWLTLGARRAEPPLEGKREADVVIVGAGLTGLWTAHHLKNLEPSLEIAVLEQKRAAYGASGRNAGILGESIDHSHALAISHFGRDEAVRLARLGHDNAAELRSFLHASSIDCDLEETGMFHVALSPPQIEELKADLRAAEELGLHHFRYMGQEEIQAEIHSPRYHGALFNPRGAILDPVKLVDGLMQEAMRRGVKVYENSRVTGFEPSGAGVTVLAGGALRAR